MEKRVENNEGDKVEMGDNSKKMLFRVLEQSVASRYRGKSYAEWESTGRDDMSETGTGNTSTRAGQETVPFLVWKIICFGL